MPEFETRGRYSNSESSLHTKIGNMFWGTDGYPGLDDIIKFYTHEVAINRNCFISGYFFCLL